MSSASRFLSWLASALTAVALVALVALVGATPPATASRTAAPVAPAAPGRVLAISVDGLNPAALRRLGPSGAPALHRLVAEGAATLNARTAFEQTVTLPNHTSMLTGRPIDRSWGGHGLTWNDERVATVPAGRSVFDVVAEAGRSSALFAGKARFAAFERSWPIDRYTQLGGAARLVRAARADLAAADRAFTFLHLALPDAAGHRAGGLSPAYLDAVATTDRLVGRVLRTVEAEGDLTVVLTADHGFSRAAHAHTDRTLRANYRVPFVVWGPGIPAGDLYALNPRYADPRRGRPGYSGTQPVRNGNLANLATDLLGLGPVPGSRFGVDVPLEVRSLS